MRTVLVGHAWAIESGAISAVDEAVNARMSERSFMISEFNVVRTQA
jgi:hypothetical protein